MPDDGRRADARAEAGPLDALDRRLLRALIGDPRLTIVELARRCGAARATVQSRLDRLVRRGIVGGGGIALDAARIGYPLTAFVALQIRQGRGAQVQARLGAFAEVLEIHTTAGGFDLLCRVVARSSADLQHTIDRLLDSDAIVRSHTSVVLSTPMSYRVLPLLEDG